MNIIDDFTRECLAKRVAHSFGSADVIRAFEEIAFERGFSETVRIDNGSEFTSHKMLRRAAVRKIQLHFIAPGKPTQNANIESLNGKIRDELLNMHSFLTIFEARRAAEDWRTDYNHVLPHSALDFLTPREFADRSTTEPTLTTIRGLKLPYASAQRKIGGPTITTSGGIRPGLSHPEGVRDRSTTEQCELSVVV